jgi:hypothetical protein
MPDRYVVIIQQRTVASVVFKRFMNHGEIERCDDIVIDGAMDFMAASRKANAINSLPGEVERRAYRQHVIDGREYQEATDA